MSTNNDPQREYHYVITVQYQQGLPAGCIGLATRSGVITPGEGATRESLFQLVCEQVMEQAGLEGDQWWVIHFSLGLNDLY